MINFSIYVSMNLKNLDGKVHASVEPCFDNIQDSVSVIYKLLQFNHKMLLIHDATVVARGVPAWFKVTYNLHEKLMTTLLQSVKWLLCEQLSPEYVHNTVFIFT